MSAEASARLFIEELLRVASEAPGREGPAPQVEGSAESGPPLAAEFAAGNWDRVLALAEERCEGPADLERVVRSAYNLDTTESATRAVDVLDAASQETLDAARKDRFFREAEQSVRALRAPAHGPNPESFLDLFQALADGTMTSVLEWADRGRYEWPTDSLRDPAQLEALAVAIARCSASPAAQAGALGALGPFIDWIAGAPRDDEFGPLYSAALDLVLYAGDASDTRDTLSIRLLADVLRVDRSPETLAGHLEDLAELWLHVAAARRIDWPLAILDVALDYGGTSDPVRQFFATVVNSAQPWLDRLDDTAAEVLRSIADEVDEPELGELLPPRPEVTADTADPLAVLSGLRVGFYTLMVGAGSRARDKVRARCPDVAEVEVNGDTVSTAALRSLAGRADAMIVAFRAAQHAATDAIVAVRGREQTTAAQGKGSVGLLRALEQWAADRPY